MTADSSMSCTTAPWCSGPPAQTVATAGHVCSHAEGLSAGRQTGCVAQVGPQLLGVKRLPGPTEVVAVRVEAIYCTVVTQEGHCPASYCLCRRGLVSTDLCVPVCSKVSYFVTLALLTL